MNAVGRELCDVPFDQLVSNIALGIAKSQAALDRNSIEILKIMGDKEKAPVSIPKILFDNDGNVLTDADDDDVNGNIVTSMIGAGFQPTFYQFAETIIEVKMSITIKSDSSYTEKNQGQRTTTTKQSSFFGLMSKTVVTSTPVDATYSSKYSYTAEGSSYMRTRLVPVPPNTFIQRLVDLRSQAMQMEMEAKLKEIELNIELQKTKATQKIKTVEDKYLPVNNNSNTTTPSNNNNNDHVDN